MAKKITIEQAFEFVTNGCSIFTGLAAAEAQDFMNNIHTIAHRLQDVNITNCMPMSICKFLDKEYSSAFNVNSWFYSAQLRASNAIGHRNISFIPNHLHLSGIKRLSYEKSLNRTEPLIFVGVATPPDKHGYVS